MVGGDAEPLRRFIERELFAPLGVEHATLEYDSAGVPFGTIHLWASARDWARLGLLYLRDGVTESGQRILPVGWVDDSTRLTPQSADEYGYGAGFWTQRGNSAAARERIAAGMPADSFMAVGSQGQFTIIIPSHDLVIVKLGWAYTPHDDHVAVERLVREIHRSTAIGKVTTWVRRDRTLRLIRMKPAWPVRCGSLRLVCQRRSSSCLVIRSIQSPVRRRTSFALRSPCRRR
jgi:CubicO group peptidase (beta-lactamase class C family)